MAILNTGIVNQMRNWVGSLVHRSGEQVAMRETHNLHAGEVRRHPAGSQTIVVISGVVWVSAGGYDYVVQHGESLKLPCDRYQALVSSAKGKHKAIYQLVSHDRSRKEGGGAF